MGLSYDIISEFVKITNDKKERPSEGIVYATIVETTDGKFVKMDGSDLITPTDTTTDIADGERVTVMVKDHKATVTGNISSPSASSGHVDRVEESLSEKIGTFELIVADKISAEELEVYKATIEVLIAGKAEIEDLEVINAEIETLKVKDADIENLIAGKASIEDLEAINAEIEHLVAKDAEIENLIVDSLKATNADIDILEAKFAEIDTLVNGNLTSDNILALKITSDKVTVEDAFIKDAMVDTISASKINAGEINTNKVSIGSEDGGMIIAGSTQQFIDKNGKVRIQIGRDANGDFTFALYGEDGQGQILNQNGITASAIEDGLIVNDMVADNAAIAGGKLDIQSVITEINEDNSTTIKSNKIYLDNEKQSLEVAFNSLKTKVDTIEDITIDGDLTSVIEQVNSNTTELQVQAGKISTLIAEDEVIKKQVTDLDGKIVEETTELNSKYTQLEQNLSGFKTSVADTYATKSSVTDLENNLETNYSTTGAMNSAIDQKAGEITASVSETYATKSEVKTIDDNLKNNYSTTTQMNSAIKVAKESVEATVKSLETTTNTELAKKANSGDVYKKTETYTQTEVNNAIKVSKDAIDLEINSINTEVNKKANSSDVYKKTETYTQTEINNAIKVSKEAIELGVSQTYETKTNVETKIENAVDNIQVGIRNLVRNSNKDYSNASYPVAGYTISEPLIKGEQYTVRLRGTLGEDRQGFGLWINGGSNLQTMLIDNKDGTYSNTFICKNDHTVQPNTIFIYTPESTSTSINTIDWIKLEKGNKATDWTPAPEDTDSSINVINGKFDNYYTKNETYTKTETNSAINVAKNSIKTEVSETYETKQNVDIKISGAIDAMEIGTKNLLFYTDLSKKGFPYTEATYGWRKASFNDNANTTRTYEWIPDCPGFPLGIGGVKYVQDETTIKQPSIAQDGIKMEDGQTYTMSAWFKLERGTDIETGLQYGTSPYPNKYEDITELGTWTKRVFTFTYDQAGQSGKDATNLYFIFRGLSFTGYVCGMKLEKGDKATDWMPSPYDIEENIVELTNDLDVVREANNESLDRLDTMDNDNIITPSEKIDLSYEFERATLGFEVANTYYNVLGNTAYEKIKEEMTSLYNTLKTKINTLKSNMSSNTNMSYSELKTNFKNFYQSQENLISALNSSLTNIVQENSSSITQMSDSIDMALSQTTTILGQVDEYAKHLRFSQEGWVEIFASQNGTEGQFKTQITDTKLAFLDNGIEVAYVSNKSLYITDAEITHSLKIGKIKLVPSGKGGIMYVWG